MNPLLSLIPALTDITQRAGAAILEIYDRPDHGVVTKTDDSPLTLADQASNRIICEGLSRLPVQYPIISEENKAVSFDQRKTWERCWLVDPLDGTKEFINRNGDFTTNIALIEKGIAILGVVGIPCQQEVYWAIQGEGAFLQTAHDLKQLTAAEFRHSDPHLNIIASRSHLNQETRDFISRYSEPHLISRGSALKFLLLAKGEAHIYPRIAPTMEWDTAAAQVILEESGGQVLVHHTGIPMRYNREDQRNPAFVAYGKVISDKG